METFQFDDDDASMTFAIAEAQRTLPEFFKQFASPRANQQHFLVKVHFESNGASEHVWIANIDAAVFPLTGTIANETSLPSLRFMDRASFHPGQISDWMIIEDGTMVGGYTNQVAIDRMSETEREQHLARLPYRVPGHFER